MEKNIKPVSKESMDKLYIRMGNTISLYTTILQEDLKYLSEINRQTETANMNTKQSLTILKNIIELHSSVLYTIIEVAAALRAEFRSEINLEKRANLKYLVAIISDFYKATFLKPQNSLWNKITLFLSTLNIKEINKLVDVINKNRSIYENTYYINDKDNRDISVHYDLDVELLYNYISNISESDEVKRVCCFLDIALPLTEVLSISFALINLNVRIDNKIFSEKVSDTQLLNSLKESYPQIGKNIKCLSTRLERVMHQYHLLHKPSSKILSLLERDSVRKLKEKSECIELALLLNYIYLDLSTAIRGYMSSECYIEKRINLLRINVIIYEGYKKIYHQKGKENSTLWEHYIVCPISHIKNELFSVDRTLKSYHIDDIRHKYIHMRNKNKFNLPDLWDAILTMDSYSELNKSKDFLQLLTKVIRLNQISMHIIFDEDLSI